MRLRATNTVTWPVDRRDYFQCDPVEIIDIWLFRDRTSYTNYARLLFQRSLGGRLLFGYPIAFLGLAVAL